MYFGRNSGIGRTDRRFVMLGAIFLRSQTSIGALVGDLWIGETVV